jgi:hypothetical protein
MEALYLLLLSQNSFALFVVQSIEMLLHAAAFLEAGALQTSNDLSQIQNKALKLNTLLLSLTLSSEW